MSVPATLESATPLAWIDRHKFVTENQKPFEFIQHRFMIDPLIDMHPDQVLLKCAQVGMSSNGILKSAFVAKEMRLNVIYTLPTQNVIKDFVIPKVNPIIGSNPALQAMIAGSDSIELKNFGDRFVYFRGAFSKTQAVMIAADVLIHDELDQSDPAVITTFKSRLDASEYGYIWAWSNPSFPNFGTHALWLDSDQRHWFVKCHSCQHEWFIWYDNSRMDEKAHWLDKETKSYRCGKCQGEIDVYDRQNGRWVAKYPSRYRHGYWVSQMIAPWISAAKIVSQQMTEPNDFLHNFVYGLPYQDADILLDRAAIIRAMGTGKVEETTVVMGTDVGNLKHTVIGTPTGVFRFVKTDNWEELERLFLQYNAKAWVIDANPDQVVPHRLAKKYRGRVFVNYYVQDRKNLGIIRWMEGDDRGVVHSDRTKILDHTVNEIITQDINFYMKLADMEEFIAHALAMYRTVEENAMQVPVPKWLTQENRPDHFMHALVYWRIALTRVLTGNGMVINPTLPGDSTPKGYKANAQGELEGFSMDLDRMVKRNAQTGKGRDWENV